MSSYWIDADVLISAKNGTYPLNTRVAEVFWSILAGAFEEGTVKMTRRARKEVLSGDDDLADWLSRRRDLVTETPREVQDFAKKEIGGYLYSKDQHNYLMRHINRFSSGADPWIIAHAKIDGGAIVTNEESEPKSRKPKIPDVCSHFKVKCIHVHKLIKCLEQGVAPEHCTEKFQH